MSALLFTTLLMLGIFLFVREILRASFYRAEVDSKRRLRRMMAESNPEFLAEAGVDAEGKKKKKHTIKDSSPIMDKVSGWLERSPVLHDKEGQSFIDWIERQLVLAGLQRKYTPYQALALVLTIWSVGTVLPVLAVFAGLLNKPLFVMFVAACLVAPVATLLRMKKERQTRMKVELPWFIHELSMALATGAMTLRQALGRVSRADEVDTKKAPLQEEFAQAHLEALHGAVGWEEAMANINVRVQVPEVRNFVSTLITANQTGSDIIETLDEYAKAATDAGRQDTLAFVSAKEPQFMIGLVLMIFGLIAIFATPLVISAFSTLNVGQ